MLLCVICAICVLCLIVVPLPPDKTPFAIKINNNKKRVSAAMNTHAAIEELLEALFSIQSELYQRKIGD
jgi:hypothetical protein